MFGAQVATHILACRVFMSDKVECHELSPDEWLRLREIRLASLQDSPDAFGGNHQRESEFSELEWRELFTKNTYLVATLNGKDIAMMFLEKLRGDFGATCWVGGCWSNPQYRGTGALRAMFNYVDSVAEEKGWQIQGLGVFVVNESAIAAYEKLGFKAMGEVQESTRKPGNFYQRMIRGL
jgi:RimJ/RimL family protein N-acetyltransferase